MGSAEEFHANARQCRHMAEITRDDDCRASWLRLAETWVRLAQQETKHFQAMQEAGLEEWHRPEQRDTPSRSSH